jgi:uncharacterized protein YqeY
VTGSELKADIHRQMTDAMKSGEKVRLGALRMFVSAIRYKEDELGHELSDEEIGDVATKEVKKRSESIEAFEGAGRTELAEKERQEREVIEAFAPPRLSDEAVDALVEEAISVTGATSAKELGKVMGFVMGKAKGAVDGAVVQEKVLARLADG